MRRREGLTEADEIMKRPGARTSVLQASGNWGDRHCPPRGSNPWRSPWCESQIFFWGKPAVLHKHTGLRRSRVQLGIHPFFLPGRRTEQNNP